MKKLRIITLCALSLTPALGANAQAVAELTYNAYLNGSLNQWEAAAKKASIAYEANPSSDALYEAALATYGLLSATIKDRNKVVFDTYATIFEGQLNELDKLNHKPADVPALRSAMYGFKIVYSPERAMYYGREGSSALEKALKLNPASALVQRVYAGNQFYTPEAWGGNKEEALKAYKKSTNYFLQKGAQHNWMLLDNMTLIGIIYKGKGDKESAKQIWEESLELEPSLGWVKNRLLPSVQ